MIAQDVNDFIQWLFVSDVCAGWSDVNHFWYFFRDAETVPLSLDDLYSLYTQQRESSKIKTVVDKKLVDCDLSIRCLNVLKCEGIETVADLCAKTKNELRLIRSMGRRTLTEIDEFLAEQKLSLRAER